MKEIGGYFEFEKYRGQILHEEALALNCGRNALAYLIKARKINKLLLPYFICDSIIKLCERYDVKIRYYHIDNFFYPHNIELMEDEWLYIVNFYGQLSNENIYKLYIHYRQIILDYAQAYFEMPLKGIDTIYTCRKFFGVTDGAFLYTEVQLDEKIEEDFSFNRIHYLAGRYEKKASDFYGEYMKNNEKFYELPILRMSKITENLLRAIDYEQAKKIRTDNYEYLANKLKNINELELKQVKGAFAYPLMLKNGAYIRKKMIENKIYIPVLWPNVIRDLSNSFLEYQFAANILPLPCDQRYNEKDMEYMCQMIYKLITVD